MPYEGNFRQLGKDIADAIVEPKKLKLQLDEMEEEKLRKQEDRDLLIAEKRLSLQEKKETKEKRMAAADSIREKYGDRYADMYLAGESLSGIASLRKADADYIKAMRGPAGSRSSTDKFGEVFRGFEMLDQQLTGLQGSMAERAMQAESSGGDSAESVKQYNNFINDLESKMVPEMIQLQKVIDTGQDKTNRVKTVSESVSSKLKTLDENDYASVKDAVFKKLKARTGMSQAYLDKIDSLADKYGVQMKDDVPSTAEIQKVALQAYFNKEIDAAALESVLGGEEDMPTYAKRMTKLMSDKNTPEIVKALSSAMLKNVTAMEILGLDEDLSSKMSNEELSDFAYDYRMPETITNKAREAKLKRRK